MTTTTYRLVSINRGSGQCQHCGRALKKLCTISDGTAEIVVGINCCKELTGWAPDAAMLRRQQREDAAAAKYGDLWTRAVALKAASPVVPMNQPLHPARSLSYYAVDVMLHGSTHPASAIYTPAGQMTIGALLDLIEEM